jgi:hypothetical protein
VGYSVFQRCVLPPPPRRCISLITEALRPSETVVYFKETTRVYTVDSCNLHTSSHENLKFHISRFVFSVVIAFRRKCCLYPQGSFMFLRNVCTHLVQVHTVLQSCFTTRHEGTGVETRCSSYSFSISALDGVSGQRHAPAAL